MCEGGQGARARGREGGREDQGERIRKGAAERQMKMNFTLHETDITVHLREREFSRTHGNG